MTYEDGCLNTVFEPDEDSCIRSDQDDFFAWECDGCNQCGSIGCGDCEWCEEFL